MKQFITISLLLLFLPLSHGAVINESYTLLSQENINLTITVTGTVLEQAEIKEEEKENNTVDSCSAFNFTGLPLLISNKEKLSYTFTPWQEGDSVTYWIEDTSGEEIKEPYTTTSKAKKSYTPNIDQEEQILIFKADLERSGCADIRTQHIVGVYDGEETACPEIAEEVDACTDSLVTCPPLQEISSFYVRAKKYQEHITLYGKAKHAGNYLLFGEETPRSIFLEGNFNISVHPKVGNNTYGLIALTGGVPKILTFTLTGNEESQADAEEQETEENPDENTLSPENASLPSNTTNATLSSSPLTGNIIIEDDENKTNTTLLIGLTGIAGAGIIITAIKTKILRRKQDSM